MGLLCLLCIANITCVTTCINYINCTYYSCIMHACFKEAHIYIYRVSPFVASSLVCEKKKVTCVIIDPVACASRIIVDLDQGILGRRCLFHLLDPCHDFLMEINNQLTCAAPELSCVCKTALLLSSLTASLLLASIAVLSSLH